MTTLKNKHTNNTQEKKMTSQQKASKKQNDKRRGTTRLSPILFDGVDGKEKRDLVKEIIRKYCDKHPNAKKKDAYIAAFNLLEQTLTKN